MIYKELPLVDSIQKAIEKAGYIEPTPIQEQAIPIILQGRDLLGCAQTGTGKTAAFTLPILQKLETSNPRDGIKALIVTPTRELAIQIDECLTMYSRFMNVRHAVIFGGVKASAQIAQLKQGVQILVATPGRLLDLQNQGYVNLKKIEFFVLDEADRMLDMGFINDIRKLLKLIPAKRQTLFFSATMPDDIAELSKKILTNPFRIDIAPVSSPTEMVEQKIYFVKKDDKKDLLLDLLSDKSLESVLIFTRTKHGADKVTKILDKANITAAAIHGNKSQNARQKALAGFKEHRLRVLLATDIAARGIDIDSLSHVINYELPNVPETYVHRIGRTGRAGKEGVAISFCQEDEVFYLRDIEKLIHKKIDVVEDSEYSQVFTAAEIAIANKETKAKASKSGRERANRFSRSGSRTSSRGGSGRTDRSDGARKAGRPAQRNDSRNKKPNRY